MISLKLEVQLICYFLTYTSSWYCLLDHDFKMDDTLSFLSVINDVLRPRSALNIDHYASSRSLQIESDERTEVALGVLEGVEVAGEAAARQVAHRPDVLAVGRRLALARYPDHIRMIVSTGQASYMLLQIFGHVCW